MAGLPLKSGADFYNLEAARLRLHNLGADPTEVGAGLIYFNTSTGLNTSQKARLYTGSAWKTIAFSEDLDVASNADFLALQRRVDLLSGDVDTDAIISNMKEVSAFLEGFAEDASLMDYLNTELGKKLDISGGEMTGKLVMYNRISMGNQVIEMGKGLFGAYNDGEKLYWLTPSNETWNEILTSAGGTIEGGSNDVPLVLKSSGTTTWLKFTTNDGKNRYIGVGEDNTLKFQYGGASYPILHSGNVGEYNAGSANILASSYNENINYESYTTHLKLIKSTSGDYVANGFPAQYVSGLSVMSGYTGWQMVTYGDPASDMRPYFRAVGGEGDWQAWKQLAFTDSDITGNAATANGFARAFTNLANADLNTALAQGGIASNYNTHMSKHWQNAPDGALYGCVIQFFTNNRLDAQLLWDINHGNSDDTTRSLWWRTQDDRGFSNAKWHQIAFTDSNVAGAYKLVTSDGKEYAYKNDYGVFLGLSGSTTYIDGYKTIFRYSSSSLNGLILNSSGNVTIGGSDLAGTIKDNKLFVDGAVTAQYFNFNSKDRTNFGYIGRGGDADLVTFLTYGEQNINIGTNSKTRLTITGADGNVLIGTTTDNGSGAKLQVNGGIGLSASGNKIDEYGNIYIANTNTAWYVNAGLTYSPNVTPIIWAERTSKNVGLGTTVPQEKLDIEGGIRVNGTIYPKWGNNTDLGKNSQRWNNIFAVKASFTEDVIIDGDLHVKGNIIADGEVSAGGAAEEGGNAGGGGAFYSDTIKEDTTQTTIAHGLGTDDIVVSIYEKDGVSGRWSLILTDVEIVDANNIIVSFGSATTVEHKVVIMGAVA